MCVTGRTENAGRAWDRVRCGGTWHDIDSAFMDHIGGDGRYNEEYVLSQTLWDDHTAGYEIPAAEAVLDRAPRSPAGDTAKPS